MTTPPTPRDTSRPLFARPWRPAPIVGGGQGRSGASLEATGRDLAVLLSAAVLLAALIWAAGVGADVVAMALR